MNWFQPAAPAVREWLEGGVRCPARRLRGCSGHIPTLALRKALHGRACPRLAGADPLFYPTAQRSVAAVQPRAGTGVTAWQRQASQPGFLALVPGLGSCPFCPHGVTRPKGSHPFLCRPGTVLAGPAETAPRPQSRFAQACDGTTWSVDVSHLTLRRDYLSLVPLESLSLQSLCTTKSVSEEEMCRALFSFTLPSPFERGLEALDYRLKVGY